MSAMKWKLLNKLVFVEGYEVVKEVNTNGKGFFGLNALDIDGQNINFLDWEGKHKCFMIVNVATN